MSDNVTNLKEALAVCPICMDDFNDTTKLPRRMPCCEHPICDGCLASYIGGRNGFPCPICKIFVDLPGGGKSLPKDMTVLRLIDVRKTGRHAAPGCTDCPDDSKATATCGECGVYLCETCFTAHARHRSTRNHKTSTLEDIRRLITQNTANGGGAIKLDTSEMKTKLEELSLRMSTLSDMEKNIVKSQEIAIEHINKSFDEMVEELQCRRGLLLSEVKAKADRELKSIRTALESHMALQDKLKSASTRGQSAASLLQETPEDVEAERLAVTFTEANMGQLLSTIRSSGQVRLVTFSATQKPRYVSEDALYRAIRFAPEDIPEVSQADVKLAIGGKDVIGPNLEFDHNTASADIQVSSGVVCNIRPDPAPQDTGCRLQSERRTLTLRPLTLKRGQVVVFSTRLRFTVKQLTAERKSLWELAVSGVPVDGNWAQATGLSVRVVSCPRHKQQLCLRVVYNDKILTDVPLIKNKVGVSRDINLYIVIDRDTNRINVVDATDVKVVTTTGVPLDRPLWVMMYVDGPAYTEMESELISGRDLTLTPKMAYLLYSLIY